MSENTNDATYVCDIILFVIFLQSEGMWRFTAKCYLSIYTGHFGPDLGDISAKSDVRYYQFQNWRKLESAGSPSPSLSIYIYIYLFFPIYIQTSGQLLSGNYLSVTLTRNGKFKIQEESSYL